MAKQQEQSTQQTSKPSQAGEPHLTVPGTAVEIPTTRKSLAWYGTLAGMGVLGVLEWPVAAVVVGAHIVASNSRTPSTEAAAEGVESGA